MIASTNTRRSGRLPGLPGRRGRRGRPATGFTHLGQQTSDRPTTRQLVGLSLLTLVLATVGLQVGGLGSLLLDERWLARAEIQYRGTAWTETQDVAIRSRSLLGPIAADLNIPIKEFEEELEARLIPGTQILRVDYTSTDQDLARTVVAEVSNRYVNVASETTPAAVRATLLDELAEIDEELEAEERRFERLSNSTLVSDRPEQQASQAIINSLRARRDDVESRILDHDLATIDEAQNGVPIIVTEPFVFDEQVFPRPKIFAAIGAITGLLIGALYAAWFWNRISWRAANRRSA